MSELAPGSTFAGYRIDSELGRGGMGVVYRATDLRLERPVALKLIAPELAADEGFRKRFLRESKLAASLGHPHVLPVYQAGEEEGQLYLAMRYVEGEDLKTLLAREGRLKPERAFGICRQVAEALDTAHAKGLLHRDVKPANVLLDEQGEAYLADFGLAKQVGGAATQTGQIAGTLDYLSPEQIRGETLDGRSDEYALACVLYECLAGTPPFRRQTEAEVLWAHMQQEPPPLRAYPALDPVFQRALAKNPTERFESCRALVDSAREALGFETPRIRRRRRLLRRSRLLAVAATLVLAAAVAAAVVELTGGGSSAFASPSPNSVIEVDTRTSDILGQTSVGGNPTTIAVGEGAVWVLNADDQTISRIDAESKALRTFGTGGTPVDLAAGAGAVWIGGGTVGAGAPFGLPFLSSVSQVDPETLAVRETARLSSKGRGGEVGDSLAVGKNALWAVNPDLTVSRIDPASGNVVATVRSSVSRIAVGPSGTVWGLSFTPDLAVVRIDPATNTVTARIKVPTQDLTDLAVGVGAVWASSTEDGTVWRIDPGPPVRERTVPLEKGVTQLAFGEGAVWAVNPIEGSLSRIDPATNLVSQRIELQGTPRDVAVGEGRVWVSDAGASCGSVVYAGGGKPEYVVVSDLPLRAGPGFPALAMTRAIERVFKERGFRAGSHRVAYQPCDDSTSQVGLFDVPKCAANAKSYAEGLSVIGVVGSFNSGCAFGQIAFLNEAPRGPLAMVSPSNSYIGLTRRDPFAPPGQLATLYPTGRRNFARVFPADDAHGAAAAIFIASLGVDKAYVLVEQGFGSYPRPFVRTFRAAARERGLAVVGVSGWDPRASSLAVAERVRRSGARAVFVAGSLADQGDGIKDLRTRLGPRIAVVAAMGGPSVSELFRLLGPIARSIYLTYLGWTPERLPPAGKRFVRAFRATQPRRIVHPMVAYAAQAAAVLLDAIARSDGTRASVTKELFRTRVQNGILGTFRFDRNGDSTSQPVTILRPRRAGGSREIGSPDGAQVVRVIDVSPSLLR